MVVGDNDGDEMACRSRGGGLHRIGVRVCIFDNDDEWWLAAGEERGPRRR